MKHFRTDNTEGFSKKELNRLNDILEKRIKYLDEDHPNYHDQVQWHSENVLNVYGTVKIKGNARLSLWNEEQGSVGPDDLEEHKAEILELWDALVQAMDHDLAESINREHAGEINELEFLMIYLEKADEDLII